VADLQEQQPSQLNALSDGTGQLDPRFTLWRKFCADQGVAIDSLPSDLCAEAKEQWEKLKEGELSLTSE
jgi:hypothetical protein